MSYTESSGIKGTESNAANRQEKHTKRSGVQSRSSNWHEGADTTRRIVSEFAPVSRNSGSRTRTVFERLIALAIRATRKKEGINLGSREPKEPEVLVILAWKIGRAYFGASGFD